MSHSARNVGHGPRCLSCAYHAALDERAAREGLTDVRTWIGHSRTVTVATAPGGRVVILGRDGPAPVWIDATESHDPAGEPHDR